MRHLVEDLFYPVLGLIALASLVVIGVCVAIAIARELWMSFGTCP